MTPSIDRGLNKYKEKEGKGKLDIQSLSAFPVMLEVLYDKRDYIPK